MNVSISNSKTENKKTEVMLNVPHVFPERRLPYS